MSDDDPITTEETAWLTDDVRAAHAALSQVALYLLQGEICDVSGILAATGCLVVSLVTTSMRGDHDLEEEMLEHYFTMLRGQLAQQQTPQSTKES